MFQAAFECFPWDLDLEGYDDALARLAGDIGVDAVRVAAVHEGIHQLRPRAAETARAFVSGAAAHFQPDSRIHSNSRIRPIPAAWMKTRNPLEKIAAAARKNRLALRVSLSCCKGDALLQRHPHAACTDFFGRAGEDRLCPSHPDVRAYLGAIVEDLSTNYAVNALELEFTGFADAIGHRWYDRAFASARDPQATIFSWCFCAACTQRAADAGIEVPALRAALASMFTHWAALEPVGERTLADWMAANPFIAAYHKTRVETVASLLRSMQARSKVPLRWCLPVDGGPTPFAAEWKEYCDGCYLPVSTALHDAWPVEIVRAAGGPSQCDLALPCHPPGASDGPSLVAAVRQAAQDGYRSITFSNYGCAPEPCLDWVRQAIRYARREAS